MPRTRKSWGELRPIIRRYLGDDVEPYTHSDELLLDGWNQALDDRALQLGLEQQFWTTRRFVDDLVADQSHYAAPEEAARITRVSRVFEDGTETPLVRDERTVERTLRSSGSSSYLPMYRLMGQYVVLNPPPGEAYTGGIALECEVAEDHFSGDSSKLPLTWPIFMENLLIMDTELFVFEQQQESAGELAPDQQQSAITLLARRSRYERKLEDYLQRRSLSPGRVASFQQGA